MTTNNNLYKHILMEILPNCKNKRVLPYLDRCDALPMLDLSSNVWFYDNYEGYNYEIPKFVHIWLKNYIKKHYNYQFFLEKH